MGESERQVEVIGEMSVKGNGIQSQFTPASRVRTREKNGSLPNEEESLVSGRVTEILPRNFREAAEFQQPVFTVLFLTSRLWILYFRSSIFALLLF